MRKQDTFIDSVTHELKSPLASLQLCLETLGREGLEADAREQLRVMMLEDVDRLHAFIDDVLEGGVKHGRYIFNLSHGVFPDVEVEKLKAGVKQVHGFKKSNQ